MIQNCIDVCKQWMYGPNWCGRCLFMLRQLIQCKDAAHQRIPIVQTLLLDFQLHYKDVRYKIGYSGTWVGGLAVDCIVKFEFATRSRLVAKKSVQRVYTALSKVLIKSPCFIVQSSIVQLILLNLIVELCTMLLFNLVKDNIKGIENIVLRWYDHIF